MLRIHEPIFIFLKLTDTPSTMWKDLQWIQMPVTPPKQQLRFQVFFFVFFNVCDFTPRIDQHVFPISLPRPFYF